MFEGDRGRPYGVDRACIARCQACVMEFLQACASLTYACLGYYGSVLNCRSTVYWQSTAKSLPES